VRLCRAASPRACRHGAGRGVVEDQHDLREQAVPRREIDDASAAEQPPRAAGHFPRFVELLARKDAGGADGAADAIEECLRGKALEVVGGEARLRRRREGAPHDRQVRSLAVRVLIVEASAFIRAASTPDAEAASFSISPARVSRVSSEPFASLSLSALSIALLSAEARAAFSALLRVS